jgi:hypothetical protein
MGGAAPVSVPKEQPTMAQAKLECALQPTRAFAMKSMTENISNATKQKSDK